MNGHKDAMKELLDRKANPDAIDDQGKTLADLAKTSECKKVLEKVPRLHLHMTPQSTL
jgi:ankyrin repeat protein